MKKVFLSVMILGIALVGACNRTANQAPSSGAQSKAPDTPSVSTPSSTMEPSSPSSSADAKSSASQQEPASKELSKQDESTAMPRPGQGGADHSTLAREPGAKG